MLDSVDPLSLEFFMSPKCPLAQVTTEDIIVEACPGEVAKEPEDNASVEDQS